MALGSRPSSFLRYSSTAQYAQYSVLEILGSTRRQYHSCGTQYFDLLAAAATVDVEYYYWVSFDQEIKAMAPQLPIAPSDSVGGGRTPLWSEGGAARWERRRSAECGAAALLFPSHPGHTMFLSVAATNGGFVFAKAC